MSINRRNLIFLPDATATYSFCGVFFRSGSTVEDKFGLAHLCEHLLMPHTDDYYEFEAVTHKELISFVSMQKPSDTVLALEKLIETLSKPVTQDRFKIEKAALELELREYQLDETHQTLLQKLFPGHPYAQPAGGSPESIAALTLPEAGHYIENYLTKTKGVWVIAGNFDLDATKKFLATHACGTEYVFVNNPPYGMARTAVCDIEKDEALERILCLVPLVAINDFETRLKLMIIRTAFVGYQFSVLNNELRERQQLIYSTESESVFYQQAGYLSLSCFCLPGKGEAVLASLRKLLRNTDTVLTSEVLRLARSRVTFELLQAMRRPEAVGWWAGEDMALADKTIELKCALEKVARYSEGELRATAAIFFKHAFEF